MKPFPKKSHTTAVCTVRILLLRTSLVIRFVENFTEGFKSSSNSNILLKLKLCSSLVFDVSWHVMHEREIKPHFDLDYFISDELFCCSFQKLLVLDNI